MRIIYLHQHFKSPDMSGGTRSYEMARRWAKHGHDVHIVCAGSGSPNSSHRWQERELAGFYVHTLALPYSNSMSYAQRIKIFFEFALHSAKKSIKLKADVVFASSTPLTIALPGVRAAKALGVPLVFEVRDLWPEMPIAVGALRNPLLVYAARQLERYAYRNSSHIVALSPGMASGVARTGYPENRITVIPNSCDFALFDDPGVSSETFLAEHTYLQGKKLVAYTGTLGKINGVGYLANMASACLELDPNIAFVIAGEGAEYDLVRNKARKLGVLDRNFFMIGSVTKTQVPEILKASSVATSVVIDLKENHNNSANKFFDAMAASKPIMINHHGWQADLLNETGAGFVVPVKNPKQGAVILRDFLQDSERVKDAARASFALGKARFDRDKLSMQALEVLKRAVKAAR